MSYVNPKVASKYFNVYEKHHLHMEYRRKIKYTTTDNPRILTFKSTMTVIFL